MALGRFRVRLALPFLVAVLLFSYLTLYPSPVQSSTTQQPEKQEAINYEPKRKEPVKQSIKKMTMDDLLKLDITNMTLEDIERLYHENSKVIRNEVTLRVVRINGKCDEERPNHHIYNMYAFNELSLSWCPVFKSGSTTWKNYFISTFLSNNEGPPFPLNALEKRKLVPSSSVSFQIILLRNSGFIVTY